ncbi:FadR family transcriptional regulator [Halioglobus maricola]|uniref:FadR family transcriptional regulator n=1 Tax=Halioglobus maricola TaxID=2601894 RepID=A0A5P9NJE6_9GAMM|nr:FadR/GntR family transcriptional regulator [Halioglobus maricola]QFU75950.1 FadR family transcriptional regulator [Halioglobus maricola]
MAATERDSPIQAIKVQRLYLQVARQLEELIASGTFTPGKRLPAERELAAQFEVSRPTIREAMIALELAGHVEVRSGSGVYVLETTKSHDTLGLGEAPGPFEILEARRLIEAEACALAAQRITPGEIATLNSLLVQMEDDSVAVEAAELIDFEFHRTIANACGNSALTASIEWLWQLRKESEISTHFHRRVREEGSRPIVADHQRIVDALRSQDASAARDAMHGHLQRVIDNLMETM